MVTLEVIRWVEYVSILNIQDSSNILYQAFIKEHELIDDLLFEVP